jgi:DNA-binding CsgD family transcriptional regulator
VSDPAPNLPARDRQRILDAAMPLLVIRARLCADRAGDRHGVEVERFGSAAHAQERVAELCRVPDELIAVTQLAGLDHTTYPEIMRRNESAVQRGQRMTSLFDITGAPLATAERLLNARHMPYYFGFGPVRLKVFDRRTVLVDGPPTIETPSIMLISRPDAVAAALGYVKVVRSYSVAVGDLVRDPVDLNRREHAIARLLAEGASDSAIARTLSISVRTVRADVAALSEALGASTRFAAGVKYGVLLSTDRAFRDASVEARISG